MENKEVIKWLNRIKYKLPYLDVDLDSEEIEAIGVAAELLKDCTSCKYGEYNDHYDTYFCYNDNSCHNFNLYEFDLKLYDDENINTPSNLEVNPELRIKFLKRQYEVVLEENKKLKAKLSNNLNHEKTWVEQNSKNITQFTYFGEYKCPYCGKISFSPYDYCPNCGRKVERSKK